MLIGYLVILYYIKRDYAGRLKAHQRTGGSGKRRNSVEKPNYRGH
jgi:hypothetical protein